MDLKKLFLDTLKTVNPDIRLQPGFPFYDLLIDTLTPGLEELQKQSDEADVRFNYANFFDENGYIKSDEYYQILKETFFIGNGVAQSIVPVYLTATDVQTSAIFPVDIIIQKDDAIFTILAGEYENLVTEQIDEQNAYRFIAIGSENDIPAGSWEVVSGLPAEFDDIISLDNSSGGVTPTESVTATNFLLGLSNRGMSTASSIEYQLMNTMALPITPTKLSILTFNTPEYEHVVSVDTTDYFTIPGYADILLHFSLLTATLTSVGELDYDYSMYCHHFSGGLYHVNSVTDLSDIAVEFSVDYIKKIVFTYTKDVKINYVTTDDTLLTQAQNAILGMPQTNIGGILSVKTFYPVVAYATDDCFEDGNPAKTLTVNQELQQYTFPDLQALDLAKISADISTLTGYTLKKLNIRIGNELQTLIDSGLTAVTVISYNKEIILSNSNTIVLGGFKDAT